MLRHIAFATFASFALAGCTLSTAEPVGYAQVSSAPVPVNIETYPSTSYEGRPVYYYGDRWYYRDGPRWNYYRDEPRPLYEHRTRLIVVTPPRRDHDPRNDRNDRNDHNDRNDRHDRR